ncbi:insulin-like growth factor-binding protein complex acid labile subunit isoform X1 [Gigantopelta aegis]|uniref:insulin-like growth factor-binding protein complex acid labile subunit isoform X1 n=1 Tax=Gigantopelta aegis TaxID=1735272 RepID=UPI001B888C61|nr:insulin-like growth factor-binding protein complex acid labile subunit isoform X1 [Gigantopelta aegis]
MFFLWIIPWWFCFQEGLYIVQGHPCPVPCDCREDHVTDLGTTYIVYCGHKNLTQVPDFKPLTAVKLPKLISVADNRITDMNKTNFPPGLDITILNIGGNRNLWIADDTFLHSRNTLIHLTLEASGLFFNKTLTFLKDLYRLKKLDLSYNNMHLPSYDLDDTVIHLTDALFKDQGLTSLTYIKMYGCGIGSMAADVFDGLDNLQTLDIAVNVMTDIPDAIRQLKNLKTLDFSNGKIRHLRGGRFLGMNKLEKIKLNYNNLKIIDGNAFKGLESTLRDLELRGCSLTTVPTNAIKNLKGLKSLNLASNRISRIYSNSLDGSYCLNELDISNMKILFRQDMFDGQKSCLKDLKLRNMSLSSIPLKTLSKLPNLRYLFLNNNFIKVLRRNAFKGIRAQTITLSNSPLKTIEKGAFNGLPRPMYLGIERTNITNLQFFFDYKENTFGWLGVRGSSIPCDCTLARIMSNMADSGLYGYCLYYGRQLHFRSNELLSILSSDCPSTFTAAPKYDLKTIEEHTTFVTIYSNNSSNKRIFISLDIILLVAGNLLAF